MKSAPTTIDFARAEARKRWTKATAFRVGFVVGQLRLTAACPYAAGSRGATNYAEGVTWGRTQRVKAGG